jgi:glutathione S-transferase
MVQLVDSDIKTREVLAWRGLHLLHFATSSCSQKTRIVMNLKGIAWESHLIDLRSQQNMEDWFLGINPRGLVPVLVHDGAVHIESNDIIAYLDRTFAGTQLIPTGREAEIAALLHEEDELHLDLRTVSMRFVFPTKIALRPPAKLEKYAAGGSGQVAGKPDDRRPIEIAFWESLAAHGISDAQGRASALKFKTHFTQLDERLAKHAYLLGDSLTILDIAWFIYANRLSLAGYPMESFHPRLAKWFDALKARPEFAKEVELAAPTREVIEQHRRDQIAAGTSLQHVLKAA